MRKLANTPERIVDRSGGTRFYCAVCGGTYASHKNARKCNCRVYVSADTLKREIRHAAARERASW